MIKVYDKDRPCRAWLLLRPRQLAARRAFLDNARYHCDTCRTTWPSA